MGLIVAFFVLFLLCCGVYALCSYALAWYEYSSTHPDALAERGNHLALAAWLLLQEALAVGVNLLLYPAGWFTLRIPPREDRETTPVLLVHGLFLNSGCWLLTEWRLRQRGYEEVHLLNLPPWAEVETLTDLLEARIDDLRRTLGAERVDLVGHSLGGIVIRNYLQGRGGASLVRRAVFLGTPHAGSRLAPFAVSPAAADLVPGCDFLTALNAAPLPDGVALTAIQSRHDNIVLPWQSSRLTGAVNVELTGMGHNGMLYHPAAFDALDAALRGTASDSP